MILAQSAVVALAADERIGLMAALLAFGGGREHS
jgi:hypothetical protein